MPASWPQGLRLSSEVLQWITVTMSSWKHKDTIHDVCAHSIQPHTGSFQVKQEDKFCNFCKLRCIWQTRLATHSQPNKSTQHTSEQWIISKQTETQVILSFAFLPPHTNWMDFISRAVCTLLEAERMSSSGGGPGDNLGWTQPHAHADIAELSPNCETAKVSSACGRQVVI